MPQVTVSDTRFPTVCQSFDLLGTGRGKPSSGFGAFGEHFTRLNLGKVGASMEMYRQMEASGALQILGAFAPGLVGLASILVYGLPHYNGRRVCAMESLYVFPSARKGGAGIKLLRAAEDLAASLGASALMVSSPIGGRLGRVLPLAGYRETSRVFIRGLA